MRRQFGIALLVLGLVPIALLVPFIVWVSHARIVGLSMDARAVATLTGTAIFSVSCVAGGLYLLMRPAR